MPNKFKNGKATFYRNKVKQLRGAITSIRYQLDFLYENSTTQQSKNSIFNILDRFEQLLNLGITDFQILLSDEQRIECDSLACGLDPGNPDLFAYFPGDIDQDEDVDIGDFAALLNYLMESQMYTNPIYDDLVIGFKNFGEPLPHTTVGQYLDLILIGTNQDYQGYCFINTSETYAYWDAAIPTYNSDYDELATVEISEGVCINPDGIWGSAGYVWGPSVDFNPIDTLNKVETCLNWPDGGVQNLVTFSDASGNPLSVYESEEGECDLDAHDVCLQLVDDGGVEYGWKIQYQTSNSEIAGFQFMNNCITSADAIDPQTLYWDIYTWSNEPPENESRASTSSGGTYNPRYNLSLDRSIGFISGKPNNKKMKKFIAGIDGAGSIPGGGGGEPPTGSGGTGGVECFAAGTKITLKDNLEKNIEDIKVGEEVLSYNVHSKQIEIKK